MFNDLKINYKVDSLNVELSTNCNQNFPDDVLAADIALLFARVMEDSNVDTDMVILNLIEKFGYGNTERKNY